MRVGEKNYNHAQAYITNKQSSGSQYSCLKKTKKDLLLCILDTHLHFSWGFFTPLKDLFDLELRLLLKIFTHFTIFT